MAACRETMFLMGFILWASMCMVSSQGPISPCGKVCSGECRLVLQHKDGKSANISCVDNDLVDAMYENNTFEDEFCGEWGVAVYHQNYENGSQKIVPAQCDMSGNCPDMSTCTLRPSDGLTYCCAQLPVQDSKNKTNASATTHITERYGGIVMQTNLTDNMVVEGSHLEENTNMTLDQPDIPLLNCFSGCYEPEDTCRLVSECGTCRTAVTLCVRKTTVNTIFGRNRFDESFCGSQGVVVYWRNEELLPMRCYFDGGCPDGSKCLMSYTDGEGYCCSNVTDIDSSTIESSTNETFNFSSFAQPLELNKLETESNHTSLNNQTIDRDPTDLDLDKSSSDKPTNITTRTPISNDPSTQMFDLAQSTENTSENSISKSATTPHPSTLTVNNLAESVTENKGKQNVSESNTYTTTSAPRVNTEESINLAEMESSPNEEETSGGFFSNFINKMSNVIKSVIHTFTGESEAPGPNDDNKASNVTNGNNTIPLDLTGNGNSTNETSTAEFEKFSADTLPTPTPYDDFDFSNVSYHIAIFTTPPTEDADKTSNDDLHIRKKRSVENTETVQELPHQDYIGKDRVEIELTGQAHITNTEAIAHESKNNSESMHQSNEKISNLTDVVYASPTLTTEYDTTTDYTEETTSDMTTDDFSTEPTEATTLEFENTEYSTETTEATTLGFENTEYSTETTAVTALGVENTEYSTETTEATTLGFENTEYSTETTAVTALGVENTEYSTGTTEATTLGFQNTEYSTETTAVTALGLENTEYSTETTEATTLEFENTDYSTETTEATTLGFENTKYTTETTEYTTTELDSSSYLSHTSSNLEMAEDNTRKSSGATDEKAGEGTTHSSIGADQQLTAKNETTSKNLNASESRNNHNGSSDHDQFRDPSPSTPKPFDNLNWSDPAFRFIVDYFTTPPIDESREQLENKNLRKEIAAESAPTDTAPTQTPIDVSQAQLENKNTRKENTPTATSQKPTTDTVVYSTPGVEIAVNKNEKSADVAYEVDENDNSILGKMENAVGSFLSWFDHGSSDKSIRMKRSAGQAGAGANRKVKFQLPTKQGPHCTSITLTSTRKVFNTYDFARDVHQQGHKTGFSTITTVVVLEQHSKIRCIEGHTFFRMGLILLARSGCSGRFFVCISNVREKGTGVVKPDTTTTTTTTTHKPVTSLLMTRLINQSEGKTVCSNTRLGSQLFSETRLRLPQGFSAFSSMTLLYQMSELPCIRGKTYHFDRTGAIVAGGCEGEFRVCLEVSPTDVMAPGNTRTTAKLPLLPKSPQQSHWHSKGKFIERCRPTIIYNPVHKGTTEKRIEVIGDHPLEVSSVAVLREFSDKKCNKQTYTFHKSFVYVSGGCWAKFRICFRILTDKMTTTPQLKFTTPSAFTTAPPPTTRLESTHKIDNTVMPFTTSKTETTDCHVVSTEAKSGSGFHVPVEALQDREIASIKVLHKEVVNDCPTKKEAAASPKNGENNECILVAVEVCYVSANEKGVTPNSRATQNNPTPVQFTTAYIKSSDPNTAAQKTTITQSTPPNNPNVNLKTLPASTTLTTSKIVTVKETKIPSLSSTPSTKTPEMYIAELTTPPTNNENSLSSTANVMTVNFTVAATTTIPSATVPKSTTANLPSTPAKTTIPSPTVPKSTTANLPSTQAKTTIPSPTVPKSTTANLPSTPAKTTIPSPTVPKSTTINLPPTQEKTTMPSPTVPKSTIANLSTKPAKSTTLSINSKSTASNLSPTPAKTAATLATTADNTPDKSTVASINTTVMSSTPANNATVLIIDTTPTSTRIPVQVCRPVQLTSTETTPAKATIFDKNQIPQKIVSVTLQPEGSDDRCIEDVTFYFEGPSLTAIDGCSGTFEVCYVSEMEANEVSETTISPSSTIPKETVTEVTTTPIVSPTVIFTNNSVKIGNTLCQVIFLASTKDKPAMADLMDTDGDVVKITRVTHQKKTEKSSDCDNGEEKKYSFKDSIVETRGGCGGQFIVCFTLKPKPAEETDGATSSTTTVSNSQTATSSSDQSKTTTLGPQVPEVCDRVLLSSDAYSSDQFIAKGESGERVPITRVDIDTEISDNVCDKKSTYAVLGSFLSVRNGCKAYFTVCFQIEAQQYDEVTTIKFPETTAPVESVSVSAPVESVSVSAPVESVSTTPAATQPTPTAVTTEESFVNEILDGMSMLINKIEYAFAGDDKKPESENQQPRNESEAVTQVMAVNSTSLGTTSTAIPMETFGVSENKTTVPSMNLSDFDTSNKMNLECVQQTLSAPNQPRIIIDSEAGIPADIRSMDLLEETGSGECAKDETFFFKKSAIIVTDDCKGTFEVCFKPAKCENLVLLSQPGSSPPPQPFKPKQDANDTTDALNSTVTIRSLTLLESGEDSLCIEWEHYFYIGKLIFVRDGCRGYFEICYVVE